jgi:thiol-disulfide isomerase/thioredoxin
MLSRRSVVQASAALLFANPAIAAQTQAAYLAQLWGGLDLIDSQGQTFRLADIPQRLKLVKLWAHWCSACLVEMPSVVAFAKSFGDETTEVLLVSNPDDWQRDQLAAQRLKLPFRLATLSPANSVSSTRAVLLDRDGAYVVPRSFLFTGPQNVLIAQHTGSYDWADEARRFKARMG